MKRILSPSTSEQRRNGEEFAPPVERRPVRHGGGNAA